MPFQLLLPFLTLESACIQMLNGRTPKRRGAMPKTAFKNKEKKEIKSLMEQMDRHRFKAEDMRK